jgi:hypothetical protein
MNMKKSNMTNSSMNSSVKTHRNRGVSSRASSVANCVVNSGVVNLGGAIVLEGGVGCFIDRNREEAGTEKRR